MKKIALTGGPCAGKSEILKFLREEYPGKLLVMKEVASHLFDNFFPLAGRDLSFTPEWAEILQGTILPVQLNTEQAWCLAASESGVPVLITDRGTMDGAAYVGDPAIFAQKFGVDVVRMHAGYDMVIHIESLATGNPEAFERERTNNPHRRESLAEAQELELKTRQAWEGHPNWVFVPNQGSLEELQARILNLFSPFLDREIERKFWLPTVPDIELGKGVAIRQGYLVTDHGELRLRQLGSEYCIAAKGDGSITREEWERKLPISIFETLWPETEGRRIEKIRYYVLSGSYLLELDVFQGSLAGLVTFECECPDELTATEFTLPDWAARAVEVTNEPAFKNKRLATDGIGKEWRR